MYVISKKTVTRRNSILEKVTPYYVINVSGFDAFILLPRERKRKNKSRSKKTLKIGYIGSRLDNQ